MTPTDAILQPRYTGIASFMRAPIATDWTGVEIGLIGVPFDGGVTNRTGARHGPRGLREASTLMRAGNQMTRTMPFQLARIADLGDAIPDHPYDCTASIEDLTRYFHRVQDAGIIPVSAGGDHSVTLPIFRGIARDRPVGMVHFDAHCDTGDQYHGCKFHHGAPFRRAVEEGLLDPKRTIQIGIRGGLNDIDLWKFSFDSGMRVIMMDEFTRMGIDAVIAEALRVVGDGPTYVSFDVDGLDPVYAPGTGTPEVGGITTVEALAILRGLRGIDCIGGDVVEVAPPWDPSGMTALTGATILYEILCLAAESVARRRG
ncbi:MAG: agmatinase [Alphaproteobacteria bacterium]|nr:agmatinase [Alphaproteobacteria bacterium]